MTTLSLAVVLLLQQSVLVFAWTDPCLCKDTVMRCSGFLPSKVRENTELLYIEKFNLEHLHHNIFSDDTFRELTLLDINADAGLTLVNGTFVGLSNLTHLGVHGEQLSNIEPSVFEGLDKVQTLDFSYNRQMMVYQLSYATDATRYILPSLINLTLTEIQSHQSDAIIFNSDLLSSIFVGRHIEYIDISGVNIALLDLRSVQELLCNSLKVAKLTNVSLAYPKNAYSMFECPSISELDISGSHMPFVKQGIKALECSEFAFPSNVETFRGSAVLQSDLVINSFELDLQNCHFRLKKIELRNNKLKWMNMTVILPDALKRSILEFDISNNILAFLAPEVLYPSVILQILKLSHNRLFVMQMNYPEQFEVLLAQSKQLQKVYLADNKLEHIPRDFFIGNEELEYIDLSENKLTVCDFNLKHMRYMKYLDLHNNLIHFLDDEPRVRLGQIFTNYMYNKNNSQNHLNNNTNLHELSQKSQGETSYRTGQSYINLESNPFACNCRQESVRMIEWLQTAEYVDRADGTYTCYFEDETLNILDSASITVRAACAHRQMIRILTIVMSITVISIAVVSVSSVLYCRHLRKIKRYQDFLQYLKDDRHGNKFLVFLSFCSEDSEFVLNHLYKPLQTKLSEITGNNRDLVCIGDEEFRLGLHVQDEVMRCTEECSVVIFVISKEFCKKDWCRMEVGEAYYQRKPIIMFMKERVEMNDMSSVLRKIFNRYTHAAWINDDGVGHCEPNLQIICESIIDLARKKPGWRM